MIVDCTRGVEFYSNEFNFDGLTRERELSMSAAFPALMRKVYVWMTLALVLTGVTAYGVATSPGILTALYSNSVLLWGLVIAEFAIVFGVSAAINRLSLTTATLLFVLYSVINGSTYAKHDGELGYYQSPKEHTVRVQGGKNTRTCSHTIRCNTCKHKSQRHPYIHFPHQCGESSRHRELSLTCQTIKVKFVRVEFYSSGAVNYHINI